MSCTKGSVAREAKVKRAQAQRDGGRPVACTCFTTGKLVPQMAATSSSRARGASEESVGVAVVSDGLRCVLVDGAGDVDGASMQNVLRDGDDLVGVSRRGGWGEGLGMRVGGRRTGVVTKNAVMLG